MHHLFNLAAGLISIFLGIFVLFHNSKDYRNKLFFLFAVTSGITSISSAGLDLSIFYLNRYIPFFGIMFPLAGSFVPPLYMHFSLGFPFYPKWVKTKHIVLIYLPAIYFTFCALTGRFFTNGAIIDHQLYVERTFDYLLYTFYGLLILIAFLIINHLKIKQVQNKIHLNQSKFLNYAAVIGGGTLLIGIFLAFFNGIDILAEETGVLLFISFIFYAIIKYQAFDIKTAIHYSLIWLGSQILVILPIVFLPIAFFGYIRPISLTTLILWGLISVVYFTILNKLIEPKIKSLALRRRYDLSNLSQEFVKTIGLISDNQSLQTLLFKLLSSNIYTEDLILLTKKANSKRFSGQFEKSDVAITLPIELLNKINQLPTIITQQLLGDIDSNGQYFLNFDIDIAFKLSIDDNLSGILCLKKKKNLKSYYFEELKFLENISVITAVHLNKLIQISKATDIASEIIHEVKNTSSGLEIITEDLLKKDKLLAEDKEQLKEVLIEMRKLHKFSQQHLSAEMLNKLSGIEKTNIQLNSLVNHAYISCKPKLKAKAIQILQQIPTNLKIYGDEILLKIVFTNLIENAVKHLDKQKDILINAKEDTNSIKINIIDSGPGIPENLHKRLFQPWIHNKSGKYFSSGLGLSLCYKIIKKHDGDIKIESKNMIGTTVSISIPKN